MPEQYRRFHDFLLDSDGELSNAAREIPAMRERIETVPQTAQTFEYSRVVSNIRLPVRAVHIEFAGQAWPLRDRYGPTGEMQRFVNPNYVHQHRFSDLVVECACGASFVRDYEMDDNRLRNSDDHHDDCLPHMRLAARSRLSRQRYDMIRRLSWLGWKGCDIAPRLGVTKDHCGGYVREYNQTLRELYTMYRAAAGRTCAYLLTYTEVDRSVLAEVYGHTERTIDRWMSEYTAFEWSYSGDWVHDEDAIETPGDSPPDIAWDNQSFEFLRVGE